MNIAGMNPAVSGGPVGGGMMMMNNTGSPAMQNTASSTEITRQSLNTYIYEYFLKVGLYDVARTLVKEEKFEMRTNPKQSPNRRKDGEVNGTDNDVMDMDGKDDIPDDLPRPIVSDSGQQSSGFLFEWFAVFSDIFAAHRSQGKMGGGGLTHASQYLLQHQQLQRMRENQTNPNLRPGMMPNQFAAMRGGQIRPNGMMNGDMARKLTPQQMQNIQQGQQKAAMHQQQQMQRDGQGDGDPNARPGTPADGDNGGSPSKRPRLDGQPFNNGMMANGRPNVPGGVQQNMMIQAGFQPNMNQAQFRQNGAMQNKAMAAGVPNGMINMANSGSPMMQAMNQFPEGIPNDMYAGRAAMGQVMQGGPNGQSGNHALQDYQMQLMLLEQQNKKRLMMARQEQHENTNPRDGQPMPGGVNMPQGMSPSGNRTSPNPTDQMKRTTQIGGMPSSPSAGDMQGRSPAGMFMNGMPQAQDFGNSAMFMKDNPQMMAGGPGGPNMRPPNSVDMNALNRQQQQARLGAQFQLQQGGQPMTQQPSQGQPQPVGTPGQRNTDMPPPSAPTAGNSAQRNNQPASPANSNAPPTPSQTSKANPKTKKGKEDANKKRPPKKNSTANAPAEDPSATPAPSTPITPVHANSFNGSTTKGGPNAQQQNQQPQPNQAMQGGSQQLQQADLGQNAQYPDFSVSAPDQNFNLDFSTLENADVLENFDFDTFLNTSAEDGFNFDGSMGVEGFGMDAGGD